MSNERQDVYSRITDKIISDLEQGVRTWMKPWNAGNLTGRITRPLRHNGIAYSGINILMLWAEAMDKGFTAPIWMTFKQAVEVATQGYSGLGFSAYQTYSGSPLPGTSAQFDFAPSTTPPYTGSPVLAFPTHLQLPYTLEWNLSLQQALGKAQTATISYVGSNGRRLISEQELSLNSFNPNFGTVYVFPTGLTSNYQALQVQFQRSVSHGVQALASYTWSNSLDYGSTYTSLTLMRGHSDFDVRHNFSGD